MRKHELHPHTAALNRSQRNKSKHARLEAMAWLAQKFPEAFNNNEKIRPLKIGIMDDILVYAAEAQKDGISKTKLREAVVVFTRRLDYLACVKGREPRIDLSGKPASDVSEEEADNAAAKIRKRVEKSIKNAKKPLMAGGQKAPPSAPMTYLGASSQEATPFYSADRAELSGVGGLSGHAVKTQSTAITVKRKAPRMLDQDALARFKTKLGLAQSPSS
jgi:ProP effector